MSARLAYSVFGFGVLTMFLLNGVSSELEEKPVEQQTSSSYKPQKSAVYSTTITPRVQFTAFFDKGKGIEGHRHVEIGISDDVAGQSWTLHLELNEILASTGTLHEFYGEEIRVEKRNRFSPCHYHGKVSCEQCQVSQSWAAVSICHGLEGAFSPDGRRHYVINPVTRSSEVSLNRPHIISEEQLTRGLCGVEQLTDNLQHVRLPLGESIGEKHGHSHRQLRQTSSKQRYLELLLVVDRRAYADIGGTDAKAKTFVEGVANFLDMVYKPLGIRIALTSAIYWRSQDKISLANGSPNPVLSAFNTYRQNNWIKDARYPNDNAQLITGVDFTGSTVGLAGVGSMCSQTRSTGVNQHGPNDGSMFAGVAYTMAHEMGHNLNMNHDDTRSCDNCTTKPCIMASSHGPSSLDEFSTCSRQDYNSLISSGGGACLDDYPRQFFGDPVCGNGLVETGEQCDCGGAQACTDPCCNGTSCRLSAGSQCSAGECCSGCRFRPYTHRCRSAADECDVAEYCSGSGRNCPMNLVKNSGTSCSSGTAYCWDGECRSISNQCASLWGSPARIADNRCYDRLNVRGDQYGNCGKNPSGAYVRCLAADVFCGLLQCQGMTVKFPIIGTSKTSLTFTFSTSTGTFSCRGASVDLGSDVPDPGLGKDGIKCGNNSVCENKRCVLLSSAADVLSQKCTPSCSSSEICTNIGTCVNPNGSTNTLAPTQAASTTPVPTQAASTTPVPTQATSTTPVHSMSSSMSPQTVGVTTTTTSHSTSMGTSTSGSCASIGSLPFTFHIFLVLFVSHVVCLGQF